MTKKQKHSLLETIASGILLAGTVAVIASFDWPVVRQVSVYSVHIMLSILVLSMLAMIIDFRRLMYTGLFCVGALCIFLKSASNDGLKLPETNASTTLHVAHINLGSLDERLDVVLEMLTAEHVDVISIQELTPDWDAMIADILMVVYPHRIQEVRIDPFGLAIYSKHDLIDRDTLVYQGKPTLAVTIEKDQQRFCLISSYLIPALDRQSEQAAAQQLSMIGDHITSTDLPVINMGEFNMVYWTNEIRQFRARTGLINSRRDITQGSLRVPYDHIFFSDELECTRFVELHDDRGDYLGLLGSYQLKSAPAHETLNSQLSFN